MASLQYQNNILPATSGNECQDDKQKNSLIKSTKVVLNGGIWRKRGRAFSKF